MPGVMISVAERAVLVGAPTATYDTEPVPVVDGNAVDAQVMSLSLSGTSLSVSWLGSNFRDGNYVATGPAALVLTRTAELSVYQLGTTPWAFVKLRFVANSALVVYSATVRQYFR